MTKDELHNTAKEQNNQATPAKKEPSGMVAAHPTPFPPMLAPFAPKPPFGMPVIRPVAKNIKTVSPVIPPEDED